MKALPIVAIGFLLGGAGGWALLSPDLFKPDDHKMLCATPYIHDGDNIRCGSVKGRLFGIDAPEMPGACRPGRECTPGDPYASRDHLRSVVTGRTVRCTQLDTDHYGRAILRCAADGKDLSCAQVDSGHAVERYGNLWCIWNR